MVSVAILGTGSWGTAMSIAIASCGTKVKLWGRDLEVINEIIDCRENIKYLPQCKVPEEVFVSSDIVEVLNEVDVVIIAVPTQSVSDLCIILKKHLLQNIPLIICSKGIEKKTLLFPSEILENFSINNPVLVLSGPSFAKEVGKLLPCSLVLSGKDKKLADFLISIISSDNFKLSYSVDILGVQVASVLKNVIAIACGIIYGNGLGHNAVATVITYGIKEIKKLYLAKGRYDLDFDTIMGPACVGDLVLTCTTHYSRNMFFGLQIGEGSSINELLKKDNVVVEGVSTVKSLFDLANSLNVRLPISDAIYKLLYEDMPLKTVINNILTSY